MIASSEGKLNVHYDYTPWEESSFGTSARIDYFEYKYLDREPYDERDQKLMMDMRKFEESYA